MSDGLSEARAERALNEGRPKTREERDEERKREAEEEADVKREYASRSKCVPSVEE
tara:strand:- start:753 stop:920 length:168 start_codon:yes stop_codon:yes gene_type:complete